MTRWPRQRLRLEELPTRLVPAGGMTVTYQFSTGLLLINGTEAGETIDVRQEAGQVRVVGHSIRSEFPGWGTVSLGSVSSANLTGIRVNANGGNDTVRFQTILTDAVSNSRNVLLHVRLDGGYGNDTLVSADGNDTLIGGPGSDTLEGGAGNDTLFGDTAYTGVTDDNVDDLYFITGQETHATSGNDTLRGGSGQDKLYGGFGADSLWGGAGDDDLYGMHGSDWLVGDDGTLTLTGNDYLRGGAGTDFVFGERGSDVLWGGTENDYLYGGTGDDRLYGDEGNDQLYGEDGTDLLYGGDHNDNLQGGAGLDYLNGQNGDDHLHGGDATDRNRNVLVGGPGNDTFVVYWDVLESFWPWDDDTILKRDIMNDAPEATVDVRVTWLVGLLT